MDGMADEDDILRELRAEFKAETYGASTMALGWGLLRCEICGSASAQSRKNGRYLCAACTQDLAADTVAHPIWTDDANRGYQEGQAL